MKKEDRYLIERGGWWHYVRRVPARFELIDTRRTIRQSLHTQSKESARARRDQMEEADALYWSTLTTSDADTAQRRYNAAVTRALALSLTYAPAAQLAVEQAPEALADRVDLAHGTEAPVVQAVLGGVEKPKVTVRQAFETYLSEIAPRELTGKSEGQRKAWIKVKRRAINNFVGLCGDIAMDDITREHGQNFYRWWLNRIEGAEALSGSAGNRDVGNMRKIYRQFYAYQGEERPNPFRDLSYRDSKRKIPPFPTAWIRDRIMAPGALDAMNREARLICLAMIETGARPSEIANLLPGQIVLDANVPYISIEPAEDREIKTTSSVREIPLVGVSLEAMRLSPAGFPRYRDKETNLSNALMKFFRTNGLFPTADHRIYSFRHSFEKRMAEAGLDYGLRCLLMGHATDRPAYGDGGSMEYRQTELLKIALPVPDWLLTGSARSAR